MLLYLSYNRFKHNEELYDAYSYSYLHIPPHPLTPSAPSAPPPPILSPDMSLWSKFIIKTPQVNPGHMGLSLAIPHITTCLEHFFQAVPLHCKENPIYVFLFWELRSLIPNFHIHVSVSDLYFPGSVHIFPCSRIGRPILEIYKSFTDIWVQELGDRTL